MPERPRLVLIDGYSNIFRAFYAIPELSNSKGRPTNAVFGFVNMLRKLLRDQTPDLVGVALDVSRRTVRTELFEDYKANRAPMPDDLREQIPAIREAIAAYRIPILEEPNYEADDVIGSLADQAVAAGYDVVIVSVDKDLMQLVGPHVTLYHGFKNKLFDAAAVEEAMGVPPERVPDVLALTGDSIDNVPGVPGIGGKGAPALIREHGSLEALLARAADVPQKRYREALLANLDQARMSLRLVTIHRDRPVPFEPERLRLEAPDPVALRKLFTELEFFSLAEELGPAESTLELPPAAEAESAEAWQAAVAALTADGRVVSLVPGDGRPCGFAVAAADGADAAYADFRRPGVAEAVRATLTGWTGEGGSELVGHDLKEVLRLLSGAGGPPPCGVPLFDTMLVSYLLRPAAHGHSLEELAFERLGHRAAGARDARWGKGQEPSLGDPRLLAAAGERVALAARLAGPMREELAGEQALAALYREIEAPLVPVLLAMEEAGILLDVPYLQAMSAELALELASLEEEIVHLAGEPFNLNSPQQLGVILFEKLGYPVLKRTQKTKGYATGAEVLEELAVRGFPLPERILRFRELSKLKSTYVDALPALTGPDGRVHTRFNQAVAATGRLSSSDPNLQNIPVRTELGQRIRRAFVAPPGAVLLVADYSQIELRVLAHIAGEEALIAAFQRGEDIHRITAATVFGTVPELVSSEQRRAAKVINFGIVYGMSAFGLAQNLKIPQKEAQRFIDAYFATYPGVKGYVDETLADAERDGKVATLYGRIRHFPDIHSKNWNLRENARRMAINARIQGTAADLMKKALIAVACRLADDHPTSRLLLTVHDELVLEVPAAAAEAVGTMVKAEMEGVAELKAPLVADVGWGTSWYDAKRD